MDGCLCFFYAHAKSDLSGRLEAGFMTKVVCIKCNWQELPL
jgi:hypothetical protein